jgi:hypothetical protein
MMGSIFATGISMIDLPKPLFSSSRTLVTPQAIQAITAAAASTEQLLSRHFSGDWGDVDTEDANANDNAIENGSRILSAYILQSGVRIWVLTEAASLTQSRLTTTVLLPSEY